MPIDLKGFNPLSALKGAGLSPTSAVAAKGPLAGSKDFLSLVKDAAQDAIKTGFGITDKSFNLDRLCELPEHLNNTVFRDWVQRAESILLRAMDHAVKSRT